MEPITIIAGSLSAAAAISALQLWFNDREWVGAWRGHQIAVRHVRGRVVVMVDGEVTLSQWRWPHKKRYREGWSHPALGDATVEVHKNVIGGQGEYTIALSIGAERVPLVEVERRWWGPRALIGLRTTVAGVSDAYHASLAPVAVEPLGDDRWVAACRLLDLTRQSSAITPDIRTAANDLQVALRRRFEARSRLGDDARDALGPHVPEEVDRIRQSLEARIEAGLEAIKSLHMAVISLEAHADETPELHRAQETLKDLQADDEVERFLKQRSQRRTTA